MIFLFLDFDLLSLDFSEGEVLGVLFVDSVIEDGFVYIYMSFV